MWNSDQVGIPTLAASDVERMTGEQLLAELGHKWELKTMFSFQVEDGTTWKAWMTMGKGRNYGKTFVHLSSEAKVKIVDSEGNDTGDRMPETFHFRGRASELVSTYQFV